MVCERPPGAFLHQPREDAAASPRSAIGSQDAPVGAVEADQDDALPGAIRGAQRAKGAGAGGARVGQQSEDQGGGGVERRPTPPTP